MRKHKAILAAAILALAGAMLPARALAGTVQPDIIGLFPKDVGEFAYADLKSARKFGWYTQLKDQMLPSRFRQFEAFLASAGIDPERQVNEVVWGVTAAAPETGEQIVGVALGQYSPESAEAYFKQQKLPTTKVRGYTLFAFGSGVGPGDIFFFFVDSNTAAFGHRAILEKLIEVRFGAEESLLRNEKMFPLIDEVNGRGLVWGVLDQGFTRMAVQQLVPEAAQFPDAPKLVAKIRALTIVIEADREIEARFQAVCETTDDANLFATLLQAGLLYRRYQENPNNPDLAKTLDEVKVTPRGDRMNVQMNLSEEMMQALLRRNTFAVKM
ncbi:MAG: hypothetical protein HY234_11475 [Acidobacteria bacterium]|nr:hypothetical protein [Acidobacteriota bacterium]MBI3663653.1 hypothetical protein [Acidobacteriota bacterium]